MHTIDINHDIQTDDLIGLREAFYALLDPTRDIIVDDSADPISDTKRASVLSLVTNMMVADLGTMPRGLCNILALPHGSCYSDGASVAETKGGNDG